MARTSKHLIKEHKSHKSLILQQRKPTNAPKNRKPDEKRWLFGGEGKMAFENRGSAQILTKCQLTLM